MTYSSHDHIKYIEVCWSLLSLAKNIPNKNNLCSIIVNMLLKFIIGVYTLQVTTKVIANSP